MGLNGHEELSSKEITFQGRCTAPHLPNAMDHALDSHRGTPPSNWDFSRGMSKYEALLIEMAKIDKKKWSDKK